MANRVVDNLDALVGIAVKIAAARPHAIPIVFFRFGFYRFAADSGDRVVASYRGHGDLARSLAILAYMGSGVELAMRLLHRPWVQRYFWEAPELSLVLEALAVPSLENDIERFDHPLLPLLSLDIKDLIIQKRVAGPDTELQSAARNRIHHGVIFGALQWMAQRQNRDARAQANARRARCGGGQ